MPHDIGYNGPSDEYIPPQGYNQGGSGAINIGAQTATYANVSYLNSILSLLMNQSIALLGSMKSKLSEMSLAVTTDPNDVNLQSAHEVLWPAGLGNPPAHITYEYYDSLAQVNTSASNAIRKAYENAARGVTGNNAIDLIPLVEMTINEVDLIQTFADTHAGDLSDSSQRKTIELLQDWVESAITEMLQVNSLFTNPTPNILDSTTLNALSVSDATNIQAVLHVNMNNLNIELNKSLGVLQKNFASFQSLFYNNLLGPAMNMRNNVVTNLYPDILPTDLSNIINTSHNVLQTNLQSILADQMRRNQLYTSQIANTVSIIKARDTYRSYITQLAASGTSIASGTSGTMISTTSTPDQAAYFQATVPTSTAGTSNPYMALHSALAGLLDPQAHPQYLNKFGDTLTGNLELATPNDTSSITSLIDGMRPSTHTHTGSDGTSRIHGSDIIPSSLTADLINVNVKPIVPTNIQLIHQAVDTMSGIGAIDVSLSWLDDSDLLYEIQIAKVDSINTTLVNPGINPVDTTEWWDTSYLFKRNINLHIIDTIPQDHLVSVYLDANTIIDQSNKIRNDFEDVVVVYTDNSAATPTKIPIPTGVSRVGDILRIQFNTYTPLEHDNDKSYSIYYGHPNTNSMPILDPFVSNQWPISVAHTDKTVTYTNPNVDWVDGQSFISGAKSTFTFYGTAVRVLAISGASKGMGSFQLDDNSPIEVDFHSNAQDILKPFPIDNNSPIVDFDPNAQSALSPFPNNPMANLQPDKHTLRITNLARNNSGSANTEITLNSFEYLGYVVSTDMGEESNPLFKWSTNTGSATNIVGV